MLGKNYGKKRMWGGWEGGFHLLFRPQSVVRLLNPKSPSIRRGVHSGFSGRGRPEQVPIKNDATSEEGRIAIKQYPNHFSCSTL